MVTQIRLSKGQTVNRYLTPFMIIIIFSILLTSSINISSTATNKETTISITINLPKPIFSTVTMMDTICTSIDLPNSIQSGLSGEPSLPVYLANILLPSSSYQISSVNITVQKKIDYSSEIKGKPILPIQDNKPYTCNEKDNKVTEGFQKYINDEYPENKFSIGKTHYLKGYPISTIQINPFVYKPNQETLVFYEKMIVTITFNNTSNKNYQTYYRGISIDEQQIASIVDNPEDLMTYTLEQTTFNTRTNTEEILLGPTYNNGLCDSSETVDYVIVTNNDLADTTGYEYNWTDLLDHRQALDGFSGRIVTMEDIDDCTDYWNDTALFNDSAAHLREFCKDAYLDWNTQYILLGGDWDVYTESRQIVPVRMFTDIDELADFEDMPCDLYFSNLDGDWYDELNNVWAGGREGTNDKYAELSIGRFTVATAKEISYCVEKILWYDSIQDNEWLNKCCFYGGNLEWVSTSKQYMEELRLGTGAYSINRGFEEWNTLYPEYTIDTGYRFYHEDYGYDPINKLLSTINNNSVSIINHLDHGSWANTLSLGFGGGLNNTNFFLGASQACLSGRFIEGRSGAESFISETNLSGSFAMLLNTGYGYGSEASTYGASQQHDKIFWDYFFTNQSTDFSGWRLGDAMRFSKDRFSTTIDASSHAYCYVWYSWHLFGDPAQTIRITGYENVPPIISNPVPLDDASDIPINISYLSIDIFDQDGDDLTWNIETKPDIGGASGTNEGNGPKICPIFNITYGIKYVWFVNVTDGMTQIQKQYQFTVEDNRTNQPPIVTAMYPLNGSIDIELPVNYSIEIADADDDLLNWSITCSNRLNRSEILDAQGIKYLILSNLSYNSSYKVWVNVTDGIDFLSTWYTFTTRDSFTPSNPANIIAFGLNSTTIHLRWIKGSDADRTIIETNTISSWDRGSGVELYNSTGTYLNHTNLNSHSIHFYQFYSWNQTDNKYSIAEINVQSSTLNTPPEIYQELPVNNSYGVDKLVRWSVTLDEFDGDRLNWTIICDNGEMNHSENDTSGRKKLWLTDLNYNTTYGITVSVSDGYDLIQERFYFTTVERNEPPFINDINATAINKSCIRLQWTQDVHNRTIIRYNTVSTWDFIDGIEIFNNTGYEFFHTGLSENTTYHYQICYYNTTYLSYGMVLSTSETTTCNMIPEILDPSPSNNSKISSLSIDWKITLIDDDTINWSISCSNGQTIVGTNDDPGIKTLQTRELDYETTYEMVVNLSDFVYSKQRTFYFSTPNKPPSSSSPPPSGPMMLYVNNPPIAHIRSIKIGIINETFMFSAEDSNDPDGSIQAYRWDIDNDSIWDGQWTSSPFFNWTYTKEGIYTVIVEVTDGQDTATEQMIITITSSNDPPSTIDIDIPSSIYVNEPIMIRLRSYDPDNDPVCFSIDYNDTSNSTWTDFVKSNQFISLFHSWNQSGFYNITVGVNDINHKNTSIRKTIPLEIIDLNLSQETSDLQEITTIYTVNQTISLQAFSEDESNSNKTSLIWWCSDGYTTENLTLEHTFEHPGKYLIRCHKYQDDGAVSTIQQTIYVNTYAAVQNKQMPPSVLLIYALIVFSVLLIIGIIIYVLKLLIYRYKGKIKWSNTCSKDSHTLPDSFSTPNLLKNEANSKNMNRPIGSMRPLQSKDPNAVFRLEDIIERIDSLDTMDVPTIVRSYDDVKKEVSDILYSIEEDDPR